MNDAERIDADAALRCADEAMRHLLSLHGLLAKVDGLGVPHPNVDPSAGGSPNEVTYRLTSARHSIQNAAASLRRLA